VLEVMGVGGLAWPAPAPRASARRRSSSLSAPSMRRRPTQVSVDSHLDGLELPVLRSCDEFPRRRRSHPL